MWSDDESRFAAVMHAENALMRTSVRNDRSRVEDALAPDFAEIGRSGRRWTFDDTVRALETEGAHEHPETAEWLFNEVAPDLVLVTYLARRSDADSRHSSLWDVSSAHPTLRFHQGTIVPREG